MRDLLHVITNKIILRRKMTLYTVLFLDDKDNMWQTFISAYTKRYAKKMLYRGLKSNTLELNDMESLKDMTITWLDNDNIYIKDYESWD